jgi:hypothetical protein
MSNYPMFFVGDAQSPPAPIVYRLGIAVVNDGEATEYVTAVFIYSAVTDADGTGTFRLVFGSEGDIESQQHELAPRARQTLAVELSADEIEWMRRGFVIEAWVASGPRVRSDIEHLMDELLQDLT